MKAIIITPRDPLLFRDGRPFSSDPGSRAKSQGFPMPSTIIGSIRTRGGTDNHGTWQKDLHNAVLNYAMQGPLLLASPQTPKLEHICVVAPLDAVMLDQNRIRILEPLQLESDEQTNLEVAPVGFAKIDSQDKSKPDGMPKYWHWHNFMNWLVRPKDFAIQPSDLGIQGPILETRTHVSLDAKTQTAQEGALFATSALEFTQLQSSKNQHTQYQLSDAIQYGIYTQITNTETSEHHLFFLGGESRVAGFNTQEKTLLPKLNDSESGQQIQKSVLQSRACRLVLLTPAYFAYGWKPEYLLEERFGVTPQLMAAVVGKPQTISGWDYDLYKPKPTRRLVPAGSVYYFKLHGTDQAITEWLSNHWLQNISDETKKTEFSSAFPARKDGFGLCAIGTWNGQLQPLEVKP